MADIRHRVGIDVPEERVRDAFTTLEGLGGWWTRDVEGDPHEGGELRFFFGHPDPAAVMQVTSVTPTGVEWRCVAGPDEWVGTTLSFDLKCTDDQSVVVFTQAGWPAPVEFMHHCSTKWGYFLLGLKAGLEGGKATPYPDDIKISSWG
jgi:uncharacterized protein YndB with AHSA1/START domain